MNEDENQIRNKLEDVQKGYYSKHPKTYFFKNAQKMECAKQVSEQMDIDCLITRTVFIVPGTKVIYYDYTVFKTFIHNTNYMLLYTHFISLIKKLIQEHGTFEIHCNLKTFSISACHRYYSMITNAIDENHLFTVNMSKLVIYHTPYIMENITQLFSKHISKFVDRVEYVSKEQSDHRISSLFHPTTSNL